MLTTARSASVLCRTAHARSSGRRCAPCATSEVLGGGGIAQPAGRLPAPAAPPGAFGEPALARRTHMGHWQWLSAKNGGLVPSRAVSCAKKVSSSALRDRGAPTRPPPLTLSALNRAPWVLVGLCAVPTGPVAHAGSTSRSEERGPAGVSGSSSRPSAPNSRCSLQLVSVPEFPFGLATRSKSALGVQGGSPCSLQPPPRCASRPGKVPSAAPSTYS